MCLHRNFYRRVKHRGGRRCTTLRRCASQLASSKYVGPQNCPLAPRICKVNILDQVVGIGMQLLTSQILTVVHNRTSCAASFVPNERLLAVVLPGAFLG